MHLFSDTLLERNINTQTPKHSFACGIAFVIRGT